MLCQAILSAVVVTCTLSCIHANGQHLQRLDQIKDLMCVLILNGIQKDDLEPSMLKKFQQHNVNIDDLNNDELQRKCKHLNLDHKKKKTESKSHTTIKNEASTKLYETSNHGDYNPRRLSEIHISHDDTKKISDITTEHKILYKDDIEYVEYADGKPKIESVLKFWNSYVNPKRTNPHEATSHQPVNIDDIHTIQEKQNNQNYEKIKLNVNKDKKGNETGITNKIMTNYFLEKYKMDTQMTTQRNVYKEMLTSDHGFIKTYKSQEQAHNQYNLGNILDKIVSKKDPIFDQQDGEPYSQEYITNNPYMSFKDMLAAIEHKTAYPFSDIAYENTNTLKPVLPIHKISTNFYEDTIVKPINSLSKNVVKDQSRMFSFDIIKDIADNVKTIILKDLRKEIQSTIPTTPTPITIAPTTTTPTTTTPTTTTSTTTTSTTTTPTTTTTKNRPKYTPYNTETKKEEHNISESVFNKFIEFFQKLNNMKAKSTNINKNVKAFVDTENVPRNVSRFMTKIAPVSTKQLKTIDINIDGEIPLFSQPPKHYFGPQAHKIKPVPKSIKINKISDVVRKHDPITIQTNANEIPPLNMYYIPEKSLSQNIVKTILPPNRISRNEKFIAYNSVGDTDSGDTNLHHIFGSSVGSNANFNTPNEFGAKPAYCSTHDCVRTNSRKPQGNKKSVNDLKYKPYKNINSNRYRVFSDFSIRKKPSTSRYHEMLEENMSELNAPKSKIYTDCCNENKRDLKQLYDCCALKIPSRAQMSLYPTKKANYDDTHFNNFLKSQQKVTEMLERILAVKNKLRSVESL